MQFLRSLRKPEYVFRPFQVIRRISRAFRAEKAIETVVLPWGLSLRVHPNETIGSCIWRTGLHDLVASEALWRLLDPGETAVDVGANIGYMTGLMARRAGPRGRVIALEPHPDIFAELQWNVGEWGKIAGVAAIDLLEQAASDHGGRAVLNMPAVFSGNRGVASLEGSGGVGSPSCQVELTTLDDLVEPGARVNVLKLDVEGHELAALGGASRLLKTRAVRDIVFEEHGTPPTPVTERLERSGYKVFFLDATLWGPRMVSVTPDYVRERPRERDCLATLDAPRARERLAARGWRVVRKPNSAAAV